ncbi:MAG: DUF4381 domain-containing protein [Xanthomonadales bacterium]|nr:DUF4381 domain-containing protein [Gammaproteobacteria bacterium]MBT8057872.1 DUF4381 domain-containing protein [Gammaproteobacteria bacterium]NNL03693.1 DUF4381 domain-containing protein [Xanthomonadales bacterium]
MNPELQQQLAQLADIHPAAAPGVWPPAPGWWLLALLLLLFVVVLIRKILAKRAVRLRRRAWLEELAELRARHDPDEQAQDYLAGLNRLFRAVALTAFPDSHCARLEGEAWVAFVSGLMPEDEPVEDLAVLAQGPYAPAPRFDVNALDRLARTWVQKHG